VLDRTNDEDLQLDVKEGSGCLGPCIGCMQGCFHFYCCCHGAATFLCGACLTCHSALTCKTSTAHARRTSCLAAERGFTGVGRGVHRLPFQGDSRQDRRGRHGYRVRTDAQGEHGLDVLFSTHHAPNPRAQFNASSGQSDWYLSLGLLVLRCRRRLHD
jgi:hypothetical protein